MEQKLEEYADRFDENFPLFIVRNMDEDEIIKVIDECLEKGEPYEVKDYDSDVTY